MADEKTATKTKTASNGDEVLVQGNAEAPWLPGTPITPSAVTVTVTDGDGNELEAALDPGQKAQAEQAAASSTATHPGNDPHWSNPALAEPTQEEKDADIAAWNSRFG